MDLSKYKDALGKPSEGIHKHVGGLAVADIAMTIIGASLLGWLFHVGFLVALICLFATGVALHRVFHVNTTINTWLFGRV